MASAPKRWAPGEEEKYNAMLEAQGTVTPGSVTDTGTTARSGRKGIAEWLTGGAIKPAIQSNFTATGQKIGEAPQVGGLPTVQAQGQAWGTQYAADRGAQTAGLGAMGTQAAYLDAVQRGTAGPSLAEQQLASGLQAAQRQAMGTALAGRGGTAAQVAAARQQAAMGLETQQQAAQLRAQEQAQARDAYGAMLGQQQQAAQGLGALTSQQAGLEQGWQQQGLAAQQANQATALAQQQANQSAWLGARETEASTYNAALAANAAIAQANLDSANQKQERTQQGIKGLFRGLGGLVGLGG